MTNQTQQHVFLSDAELDAIAGGVRGQDGSDLLIVNNGDGSDFLKGGSRLTSDDERNPVVTIEYLILA